MAEIPGSVSPRRRLLLLGVLVFVAGVVAGCFLGIFGLRYWMFRFRPSPERIAVKKAARLQKDFKLTDAVREAILQENMRHFLEIRDEFDATHQRMEKGLAVHVNNIAELMPDEPSRARWRKEYRNYFPKRPPPPGGPPPLDPTHERPMERD